MIRPQLRFCGVIQKLIKKRKCFLLQLDKLKNQSNFYLIL